MYYRIAELPEESCLDRGRRRAQRLRPRAQGVPARREDAARRSSASPASIDGGWEQLANAYADVLGLHADTAVQTRDRQAPRARLRGRARRHHEGRGDVPLRARVEPLDAEALANLDRIYTSLEQWPELAQHPRAARPVAPTEPLELVELYAPPRPGLRGAPRPARRRRSARTAASSTSSSRRNEAAIAALARIYEQKERVDRAQGRLRARARERRRRRAGGRDPREDRAPRSPTGSDDVRRARSRRGSASSISAARIPRRSARSRTSTSSVEQWAELCDVLERHYDIADEDDDARQRPHSARAKLFNEQLEPRRLGARGLAAASSTSTTRTSRRSRDRRHLAPSQRPAGARRRAPPDGRSRRGAARRRGAQGDLPRARQDLRRRARRSRTTPPTRGGSCSRSTRATSRRWPRSRAIYRAEERWPEVIDVKMQRAEALEEPAEKIREYLEVAEHLGAAGRRQGQGDAGVREDPRDRADARRGVLRRLEKLHTAAGALGAAHRALPRSPRHARRRSREKTDLLRKDRAASSRSSSTTRTRRSTRSSTRSRGLRATCETVRYLERMAQATSRWGELIQTANTWLQEQTEPHQKIHALPAPRQVVRRGPRPPRVRAAVLRSRSSRSTRTTSACSARWRASIARAASGSSSAQTLHARARRRRHRRRSQGDPDRARRAARAADEPDRSGHRLLQARARGRSAATCRRSRPSSASTPTAARRRELVDDPHAQGRRRSPTPSRSRATKLRIGGLYETQLSDPTRRGQVYREVLEIDASNLARACAASSASTQSLHAVARSRAASSRRSSTSSRPSASASTC